MIDITDTCFDIDKGTISSDISEESMVENSFDCYMACVSDSQCNYWSYIEPAYSDMTIRKKCFLNKQKSGDYPVKKGITSGAKANVCPSATDTNSGWNSKENSVIHTLFVSTKMNSFFIVSGRKRDITSFITETAVKAGSASCFENNTQYGGELIKKITDIKDAKDCQEHCHKLEDCQFWTHDTNLQHCHLKRAKGAKTSKQEMISGPKVCGK